jgi:2-polyprenyl-6-methoxyphenol hydroxylase-like FAD-dependent oxidoreductase
MSPIGGVGINLAVQDAVAAANILAEPLRGGAVDDGVLRQVQDRREFPTRVTQAVQVFIQNNVIRNALASQSELRPPLLLRLLRSFPLLRRVPARVLGLGVRPEHIRTPERL